MQEKTDLYAVQMMPLIKQVTELCEQNGIPMLMAFCLDHCALPDGRLEMTIAGSFNLDRDLEPPKAMLLAATILRVPGFEVNLPEEVA
jgi:hypothetical protein